MFKTHISIMPSSQCVQKSIMIISFQFFSDTNLNKPNNFSKIKCRKSVPLKTNTEKTSEKTKTNHLCHDTPLLQIPKNFRKRQNQNFQEVFLDFSGSYKGYQKN